jgi:hypothetical protein
MLLLHHLSGGMLMLRKLPKLLDFSKNIMLYYGAVLVIIIGYIVLAIGDADSFTSLTLGPIILVVGYLVAIPIALLYGVNKKESDKESPEKIDSK